MARPARAPVTLQDIAEATGLSIMTVSRVVRGRPDVSADSRGKVLAAVQRLGYVPNPAARLLAGRALPGDDRILGALFSREVVTSHSYFAGVIQGIADEAAQQDCHLLFSYGLAELGTGREIPKMLRDMLTRRLILVGKVPARVVAQLRATGFALTLVDMRPPARDIDAVVCDDAAGAYEATRHLIKLGHERIALLRGPARHAFAQAMASGYRRALHESGFPLHPDLIIEAALTPGGGYEAMERLLKSAAHATAVFTNDDMAIGALRALRERGRRVPDDVALVGYDDIEYAAHTTPPLTTVAVAKEEMGRLAVRKAIAQLEGGDAHVFTLTTVAHTLVIHASCGAGRERPGPPRHFGRRQP